MQTFIYAKEIFWDIWKHPKFESFETKKQRKKEEEHPYFLRYSEILSHNFRIY